MHRCTDLAIDVVVAAGLAEDLTADPAMVPSPNHGEGLLALMAGLAQSVRHPVVLEVNYRHRLSSDCCALVHRLLSTGASGSSSLICLCPDEMRHLGCAARVPWSVKLSESVGGRISSQGGRASILRENGSCATFVLHSADTFKA